MSSSIVRSRHLIAGVAGGSVTEIPEGAVYQRDGVIVEVGAYRDLRARHPHEPVIGTGRQLLIPGLVNAHHHLGLTPVQLGVPDLPLELWNVARMVARPVDPYLDTLVSAFEMIASGVTSVQHLQAWLPGTPEQVETHLRSVLRAYDHVGMRVSFAQSVRDQNLLSFVPDRTLLAEFPSAVRARAARHLDRYRTSAENGLGLFRQLHAENLTSKRIRLQLAPTNLHWCSDGLLEQLGELAESLDVPMHMHLLETPLQREYARRRTENGAVAHLRDLGLLTSRMTLGHAVWLDDAELDAVALANAKICHNCSSNLRLRSGTARLHAILHRGITTAIGIDEAGLHDDRDMLTEIRLVLRVHRSPGLDETEVPTPAQVFRMATEHGAATTPWQGSIGVLAPGMRADLVLIDWEQVTGPFLDDLTAPLDALVLRTKPEAVAMTMCDGEVVYRNGVFTRVDQAAALEELRASFVDSVSDEVAERRALAEAMMPLLRRFYENYLPN